jgi:hypothetical protein
MARKLKTYQTSLGFFDLAVAAPSMKAVLEACGADSDLICLDLSRQPKTAGQQKPTSSNREFAGSISAAV